MTVPMVLAPVGRAMSVASVTRSAPVPLIPVPMRGATPLICAALTDWLAVSAPITAEPAGMALIVTVPLTGTALARN